MYGLFPVSAPTRFFHKSQTPEAISEPPPISNTQDHWLTDGDLTAGLTEIARDIGYE